MTTTGSGVVTPSRRQLEIAFDVGVNCWMSFPEYLLRLAEACKEEFGRDARELKMFVARVASAIFLAGVCFLVMPFRFAFPRPHAEGWLGALFDWFRGIDAPYNLFPSLHAALLLFLIDAYARHLRGLRRSAVMFWFVLIGLSPLLTHQHHVIDILGGFALAALCFFFIRPKIYLDSVERSP